MIHSRTFPRTAACYIAATLSGVPLSTFLPRKRSSFYTRLVIPKGLRVYFGRREVWRSLGTGDKGIAAYRALQFEAKGRRLFLTISRQGERMTKGQIEALVSNWLTEALDESEDNRVLDGPLTDDQRDAEQGGLSDHFDTATEALISHDYRYIIPEADELLQAAGLPALDHAGEDFARLCRRLLRAKIEYLRLESERLDGIYRDSPIDGPQRQPIDLSGGRQTDPKQTPMISTVLEKYLAANPRPARTANPLKAEFMRCIQTIGGDKPIGGITRQDCVAYKETLQTVRKLTLVTSIKHLSNLDGLFKWATTHGYFPDNALSPARGLAPSKRQAKKHALRRRPFTDEELVAVFGSAEFCRQRQERPERYWVCLILLFQACRREEAGQLYVKDLGEVDGIPYLDITDEEPDQTLKNEGSKRRVPIHPDLLRLGFLQYAGALKRQGHSRLFPQLTRKGNNGYADPVGKWFSRLVTLVGLTDPRLVAHSLRHGGITKLHSAGIPGNLVETLVGHSSGNVHEQYVHKELISMKTLREALEKLRYPGVIKVVSQT